MSPMVLGLLQPMLAKLDVLHLLQVLAGADAPSAAEQKQLSMLNQLLAVPAGGDLAWNKAVEFLTDKGYDTLALSYLQQGLMAHKVEGMVVADLASAKPAVQALLDAIINNADIPQLAAVAQCPSCNFTYGITK